jgi:magnesium-transporting ATPase (P-type)
MGKAGNSTPLASDISSLEDSTFKVGKLSVEQRKEKIHRYMKKRNERNFSKKIKVFSLSLHYVIIIIIITAFLVVIIIFSSAVYKHMLRCIIIDSYHLVTNGTRMYICSMPAAKH